MRTLAVGILMWFGFISAGAAFGGFLSLYTGTTPELPKWNGWSYFMFGAKEGAMFATTLTWPFALIGFAIALVVSQRHKS